MREDGAILIDGIQTATTCQCPHCGMHFQMVQGSGKLRGYCLKCSRVTCGKYECTVECIPIGAQLDHAEGRRTSYDSVIEKMKAEGARLL